MKIKNSETILRKNLAIIQFKTIRYIIDYTTGCNV